MQLGQVGISAIHVFFLKICFDTLFLFPGIGSSFSFPSLYWSLYHFMWSPATNFLCCLTSKPVTLSPPERCSKGFCLKPENNLDSKFFSNIKRRKNVVQIPLLSETPHLLNLLWNKDNPEQILRAMFQFRDLCSMPIWGENMF